LVKVRKGTIRLDGEDVTRLGAAARARRGLGRTFQRLDLYDSLTVEENLGLGAEAAMAGAGVVSHLFSRRRDRAHVSAAVDEALEMCGLVDLRGKQVGALSTGQRRLVDLARCVAGDFRFLLLDEPSSGLDRQETGDFANVLRQVVAERGMGVLLVEHDMSMVMDVCERIYVMDFGKCVFNGSRDEVRASETVRQAYLGSEFGGASSASMADGVAL
jgi:ABC-type branched-subunit amino acid transport system ATPase component